MPEQVNVANCEANHLSQYIFHDTNAHLKLYLTHIVNLLCCEGFEPT